MKTFNSLILLLLCTFGYTFSHAQSTSDPDSVCAGATGKIYQVTGTLGSTYTWSITNGTVMTGAGTDSITINWSATAGTDTLKVVEFNTIGCPGDTIRLAVVRLPLPTVVLTGTDSICLNSSTTLTKLKMTFTGVSPWTVAYTEAGTPRNITTTTNPYTFDSQVFTTPGTKAYAVTALTGRLGCVSSSMTGAAAVTVFPKPSTTGIRHY
jgi:hypothetical protein